eukprot:TCALIF_03674-PA protein Name:"Similar to GRIN2D Glutamate receptor ionotropic, NMDA 2D (Homo sapiens)" AED:0.45 eAED:0.49 QI:0/0/0/0.66/1/1/3/0/636
MASSVFLVQKPIFICESVPKSVIKMFQKPIQVLQALPDRVNPRVNLLLCADDFEPLEIQRFLRQNNRIGSHIPSFVIGTNLTDDYLRQFPMIHIDQEIYFVDETTRILYESYTIAEQTIVNNLLVIEEHKVAWKQTRSFLERRSNFHGRHFQIVSDNQLPYLMFDDDIVESRPVLETASGDQIVPLDNMEMSGIFWETFLVLESSLNFTYDMFVRKDRRWGVLKDGQWDGMVSTLVKEEADFILGSVTLNLMRSAVIDYLSPLAHETYGVIVKNVGREQLSWLSFLLPMSEDAWLGLVVNALFLLLVLKCFEYISSTSDPTPNVKKNPLEILGELLQDFWMLFCSYFGRKPPEEGESRIRQKTTSQILIFTIFLAGNIVFMSYKASLTSELSSRIKRIPFDSLEGLVETNYKVTTNKGGGLMIDSFARAEEGTALNQIYRKFFEDQLDQLYPDIKTGLENLVKNPYEAFFNVIESVLGYKDYQCSIIVAWKTNYPNFLSLAFPKNSRYFKFFNFKTLQFIEGGALDVLTYRYIQPFEQRQCELEGPSGLGLEKLISLFGLLGGATIMSGLIFLFETFGRVGRVSRTPTPLLPARSSRSLQYWIRTMPIKYGIANHDAFMAEMDKIIWLAKRSPDQP